MMHSEKMKEYWRKKDKGRSNEVGAWSLEDPNERRRIYTMRLNAVTSAANGKPVEALALAF